MTTNTHMVYSAGSGIALAQAALREAATCNMNLQVLEHTQANEIISAQAKITEAQRQAIQNEGTLQAQSLQYDAIEKGIGAGTSGVSFAYGMYAKAKSSPALDAADAKLTNANEFETEFNKAPKGSTTSSNMPKGQLDDETYTQLKNYESDNLKYDESHLDHLSAIKADDNARKEFVANVNAKKTQATTDRNTAKIDIQDSVSFVKQIADIGQQGASAAINGTVKSTNATNQAKVRAAQQEVQMALANLKQAIDRLLGDIQAKAQETSRYYADMASYARASAGAA